MQYAMPFSICRQHASMRLARYLEARCGPLQICNACAIVASESPVYSPANRT